MENLNKSKLFNNFLSIREHALKVIPNFSEIGLLSKKNKISNHESSVVISSEKIEIKAIDYYFSNSIARASKTMSDCRDVIYNNKKNGTNN